MFPRAAFLNRRRVSYFRGISARGTKFVEGQSIRTSIYFPVSRDLYQTTKRSTRVKLRRKGKVTLTKDPNPLDLRQEGQEGSIQFQEGP